MRVLKPLAAGEPTGAMTLVLPAGQRVRLSVEHGHARLAATTWHPQFGCAVSNQCVIVALDGGMSRVRLDWVQ